MSESYAVDVDSSLFAGSAAPPTSKVDGLVIKFDLHLVENKLKSWGGVVGTDKNGLEQKVEGAGRPVYDEVEYIEIVVPGDRSNVVHRPVTQQDRQKYARQYAAWKAGNQEATSGTPLSAWPGISRAQVEELAYFKIRTVEQLAGVSDANITNIAFASDLRRRAQAYLEQAKGNAPLEAALAEIAHLKATLAAKSAPLPSTQELVVEKPKRTRKQIPE